MCFVIDFLFHIIFLWSGTCTSGCWISISCLSSLSLTMSFSLQSQPQWLCLIPHTWLVLPCPVRCLPSACVHITNHIDQLTAPVLWVWYQHANIFTYNNIIFILPIVLHFIIFVVLPRNVFAKNSYLLWYTHSANSASFNIAFFIVGSFGIPRCNYCIRSLTSRVSCHVKFLFMSLQLYL